MYSLTLFLFLTAVAYYLYVLKINGYSHRTGRWSNRRRGFKFK